MTQMNTEEKRKLDVESYESKGSQGELTGWRCEGGISLTHFNIFTCSRDMRGLVGLSGQESINR